ncbi:MAG: hypothetical protein LBD75_02420 [Candidatus Peribacteria bacterium]|jgi:septal ring factor EnvC (AmiA/AmiB activator)|nr:hypothetical protein [Candidatus Peribacteria bacterium]
MSSSPETPTSLETIHDLEHQINDLKKKSAALKAEIQQRKLNQTEQSKKQAEIDQQVSEVQRKLQAVEAQTDEERVYKERLLNELTKVKSDLANLVNEVVNGANAPAGTPVAPEKKGWRGRNRDRTKELWNESGENKFKMV